MPKFQALPAAGGFALRPPIASGGWGLRSQAPKTAPHLRNFGYAPATLCTNYNHMGFLSICFEQFFLDRSVGNLMMLTIDVCLMLFSLKSFICITHCVTSIPSSYIALSYLFAKV